MKCGLALALALCCALPGSAQQPAGGVKIWPRGVPPEGVKQKDNYGDHVVSISHRDQDGVVELHENKDDVMIVQSGHATLIYGGKGVGMHVSAPQEQQGEHIDGGTSVQVLAGDVITVAAGVPHQFLVPAKGEITYLLVKIIKQSK